MKKYLLLGLYLVLCSPIARAQNNQISGQVINAADGLPLPQATVSLLHVKRVTQTNQQGNFVFQNVKFPDTLLINFIGFKPIVRVLSGPEANMRFTLELQNSQLQEVVVNTGYQKLKAGRATGSFSVVDSALFNRQVGTDIFRRLEGITPSLLYDKRGGEGGLQRFTIRGISSLGSTSNSPLIVLDNFPYEGDIANINPNDVENITILRDAAATAVWGTRAGNGVIVITTKNAKYNTPLRFSLTANTTLGEKPDLFAYPQISSADFLKVEKYLYDQGFYTPIITNTRNRPVLSPYIELLEQKRLGRISDTELNDQYSLWEQQDGRNDFDQYFQRPSLRQQYSLNFNGGGKQLNYVGSMGWDANQANAVGNENDRFTFRNQISLKPIQKLNITAGVIYTQQKAALNGFASFNSLRPLGGRSNYYPYVDLVDGQGNALAVEKDYRKNYVDTAGAGKLLNWNYRPLDEISNEINKQKNSDFLINAQADYQVLRFLKASIQYRYQNNIGQAKNNHTENSYFTRDLVNRFTQINGATILRPVPIGGILDEQNSELNAYDIRGQLDVDKSWGKHQLSAILGGELREAKRDASSFRIYGFDVLNYTNANVDLVNRYPVYGSLSGNTNVPSYGGLSSQLDRNVSYYSILNYSYGRKYDFSLSARKDASNLFGVNANQKGVPLGSVGAAWHIDQENFYQLPWLPYLTLKSSYGLTGNVNNSISALTTIRYDQIFLGITSFTGLPQATIINPPNPNLKWETVKIFNTSLDFATRNSRISGMLAYFHKNSTDLISQIAVDATTGGNNIRTTNNAALRNQGIEVDLRTINMKGKFNWSSNFLFSSSHTKVLEYYNAPASATTYVGSGLGITPIVGKPAYGIISYRSAGLDQNGDPNVFAAGVATKDYAGLQGKIVFDDLVFHGPALPVYFGAIRNNLGYGNFDLSFNISYKLGYFYRRSGLNYNTLYNWGAVPEFTERWQKPGDELTTRVPAMVYPNNALRDEAYVNSDGLVEKGDHIRLQDLRLGYQFPNKWLHTVHLKSLHLFMIANNLGILWKASKFPYDPEYGTTFKPIKTISFGIKTDF